MNSTYGNDTNAFVLNLVIGGDTSGGKMVDLDDVNTQLVNNNDNTASVTEDVLESWTTCLTALYDYSNCLSTKLTNFLWGLFVSSGPVEDTNNRDVSIHETSDMSLCKVGQLFYSAVVTAFSSMSYAILSAIDPEIFYPSHTADGKGFVSGPLDVKTGVELGGQKSEYLDHSAVHDGAVGKSGKVLKNQRKKDYHLSDLVALHVDDTVGLSHTGRSFYAHSVNVLYVQADEQNFQRESSQSAQNGTSKFIGGELEVFNPRPFTLVNTYGASDHIGTNQTHINSSMNNTTPSNTVVVTPVTGKFIQFRGDALHRVRRFYSTESSFSELSDSDNHTEPDETNDNVSPYLRVSLVLETYKIPPEYYPWTTRFKNLAK